MGRAGAGRRGGRDGGCGRSGAQSIVETRKRSSAEAKLTEVSPSKDGMGTTPLQLSWKEPGVITTVEESGVQKQLIFGEGKGGKNYIPRSGTPPPPPSARDQKKAKKHSTPKKDKQSSGSAGSDAEHRREQ